MRKSGEDELRRALDRLPRWSGSVDSITRHVQLSDSKAESLAERVREAARDVGHECDVERTGGALRFRLTTPEAGGVTELDIDLAKRIDTLLLEVDTRDLPAAG